MGKEEERNQCSFPLATGNPQLNFYCFSSLSGLSICSAPCSESPHTCEMPVLAGSRGGRNLIQESKPHVAGTRV